MDIRTKYRATNALLYHNREVKPHAFNIFKKAYIVGTHIWLVEHCANDWKRETGDTHPIEELSYSEAYEYAKSIKLI